MSFRQRLAVYYGLTEDQRLAAEIERDRLRPWRAAAALVGLIVVVGVPTLIVNLILGRAFTGAQLGRTALATCGVLVLMMWATTAIAWLGRRRRR